MQNNNHMLTESKQSSQQHSDDIWSQQHSDDIWRSAANAANAADGMAYCAFVELLFGLWAGAGRSKEPDETTRKVWYSCVKDLTKEQFGRGIIRYLTERSSEFLNIQLIRELSGVQEAKSAAPMLAWDIVIKAINRVGAYETPKFKDQLISVVIKHLGGWIKVCDTPSEELHKWTRQTFERTYTALSSAKPESARLTNLIDLSNAQTGMTERAIAVSRQIAAAQAARFIEADGNGRYLNAEVQAAERKL